MINDPCLFTSLGLLFPRTSIFLSALRKSNIMKLANILLAGSAALLNADPALFPSTLSKDFAYRPRSVTKTISETIVRSISPHKISHRDGLPFNEADAEIRSSAVASALDLLTLRHSNVPRVIQGSSTPTSASPTIPQRAPSGVPFFSLHTMSYIVSPIPSVRPSNIGRAESQDQVAKPPDYWTLMVKFNGYDVVLPILRDNATKFCGTVMKNAGAGNANAPTSAPATTSASADSRSGKTAATTDTLADDTATSSAATTTSATLQGTQDSILPSSGAKSSNKGKGPPDATSSSTESHADSSTEAGSSMATPTGKPPVSLESSTTSTKDSNDPDETDKSATSASPTASVKGSKSTAIPNTTASDSDGATSTDDFSSTAGRKTKDAVTSDASSGAQAAEATITSASKKPKKTTSSDDSFVAYTSTPTADVSSAATTSDSTDNAKVKREADLPSASASANIAPWYRVPFVWRRQGRVVNIESHGEEAMDNEAQVNKEQQHESEDDDDTATAAAESTKPTFGIVFSSTTADPTGTPTLDPETSSDDQDTSTSSSKKPAKTNTQSGTEPTKNTHPSKTAESTASGT
jgi:hypothetical protein